MLPPIHQIQIKDDLSNLKRTIFDRLLPAFDNIENKARGKAKEYIEKSNNNFDPEFDDIGIIYENANSIEVSYYLIEHDFKQHFIKSNTIYLFHLFEKNLQSIFNKDKNIGSFTEKEMDKKTEGCFSSNPDWLVIKNELSLLNNALKHGEGRSFEQLKTNYPKYFKNYNALHNNFLKPDDIFVTEETLKNFFECMDNVWNIIFPHYIYPS